MPIQARSPRCFNKSPSSWILVCIARFHHANRLRLMSGAEARCGEIARTYPNSEFFRSLFKRAVKLYPIKLKSIPQTRVK